MYTTTNTVSGHTSDPTIEALILSSGQPPRYLDFPTRPHRQTPGHTNQSESSKHARHFLFSSFEHESVLQDAGDTLACAALLGEGSAFWMLATAWVRVLRVVQISWSSADGEGASGVKGVTPSRNRAHMSGCARNF